jgi:hypothetical protein
MIAQREPHITTMNQEMHRLGKRRRHMAEAKNEGFHEDGNTIDPSMFHH